MGKIFGESLVRAIAWAVVFSAAFLLTMGLTMRMMKQELKEMIQYASTEALGTSLEALTSREVFPLLKQNL